MIFSAVLIIISIGLREPHAFLSGSSGLGVLTVRRVRVRSTWVPHLLQSLTVAVE